MVGRGLHSMMFVHNTFASIARGAWFHLLWGQTQIFLPSFFQFSCRWVNIVLLVDGIHTLAHVVIVDPTWTNLVSWVVLVRGMATTLATHVKEGLYHDCYPTYVFLFLTMKFFAIKVFGCLQQHVDNFFSLMC